jgi:indolepyruvate ferredoxin oxidoreductase
VTRRRRQVDAAALLARAASLPQPALPPLARPYDLVVTGVGGTGVVTMASIVAMVAHLEGKGSRSWTSWASRRSSGR